jgi:hypothetical protein
MSDLERENEALRARIAELHALYAPTPTAELAVTRAPIHDHDPSSPVSSTFVALTSEDPMEALYPPPPELVDAVRRYHVAQRDDLLRRVAEIEALLGFVQVADELAVRVSKLEAFTGVKG